MIHSTSVRRASSALLGSAVAAASLLAATAAPASAAYPGCAATGYFCVYKNGGGASGGYKAYPEQDNNYSDNNFTSCTLNCNVNDNVSSRWNREDFTVRSFQDTSFGGSAMDTPANTQLPSMPSGYNDSVSSHRRL